MADETVNIEIRANAENAMREIARVRAAVEDLAKRMPGGSVPPGGGVAPSAPGLPPSQPSLPVSTPRVGPTPMPGPPSLPSVPPRIPPVPPAIPVPTRPGAAGGPPSTVPAATPSIVDAVKRALGLGGGGGGGSGGTGAGSAVRQMATSGQSVALLLFPNASAGAEFLRAQGWSSSHLGTPQGVAQAGGMVGSTSAPGVTQARRTAQALRQAGVSPLATALSQNAGGAPVEPFANLLATSGALPGPAGNAIRAIAGRGTYGVASASDMQALQALKASTAGDLQAQVESLRGQRSTIAANLSGGRYRTAGAQAGARTQLGALDQKIGNLVAAMSTLDEATAAATAALAVTGATKPTGPSVGARVSSAGRTAVGVARRAASVLGPVAGIASLGGVAASVAGYFSTANEAGRAWVRAGAGGTYGPFMNATAALAGETGFSIPSALQMMSASTIASGNTGRATVLGDMTNTATFARALGLPTAQAASLLGGIASYGQVSAAGAVHLPAHVLAAAAAGSGIDPRQYLSALASVVGVAGQSNATVSAAGTSALLSSAGALANTTGLSMFRGTRGASWLSKFQGATQQGLGGGAGEFITLQAIQSAYGATHGGHTAGNFHLMALQSAGPLGWHNRKMTSAYVDSLWHRFSPMGAAGESMMAKSLGMSNAEFYSLMHHGGISAVTSALSQPAPTSAAGAALVQARNAAFLRPGGAAGSAGGVARAEAQISGISNSIGKALTPAVVAVTAQFKKLDNSMNDFLGKKGTAWGLLAGAAAAPAIAHLGLDAAGLAILAKGRKLLTGAAPVAGDAAAVGGEAIATPVSAALAIAETAAGLALAGKLLSPTLKAYHNLLPTSHAAALTAAAKSLQTQYGGAISAASTRYGLPAALIQSTILTEDPALSPVANPANSASGPHGLMQVLGGSFQPTKNIDQGAAMLGAAYRKYHKVAWAAATAYQSPLVMQDLQGVLHAHGLHVASSSWAQAQPYLSQAVSEAARQNPTVAANQKQILQQMEGYPGRLQQAATAVYQANGLKIVVTVEPEPGVAAHNPA